jgi:starch phosphorylase
LYAKYKSLEEVKKRVVFTTHTPEMAGNEEHSYGLLKEMSFFYHLKPEEAKSLLNMEGDKFNYTLGALKFSKIANGVSKIHGKVAREMWGKYPGICEITSITNAQNKTYWKDEKLEAAIAENYNDVIILRKKEMKRDLFRLVADQCGKIFDENVLTIVWARRFAGYKRADLLMYDWNRFLALVNNTKQPVQIIWAGKPYPEDYGAIGLFNQIISRVRPFANCAVLVGYELGLSALLKKGSDVWLNNPRMYREASGTSGMTAAMNGSVSVSMPDGWVPEFAKDGVNCFVIKQAADNLSPVEQDHQEGVSLMDLLENVVRPMYYENKEAWLTILKNAAADVAPAFESARMVDEYYKLIYSHQ